MFNTKDNFWCSEGYYGSFNVAPLPHRERLYPLSLSLCFDLPHLQQVSKLLSTEYTTVIFIETCVMHIAYITFSEGTRQSYGTMHTMNRNIKRALKQTHFILPCLVRRHNKNNNI
jgi:hypothetical protein